MDPNLLSACLPWAICLVVAVVAARLLIGFSGAQLQFARLRSLHRCQSGSAQSLSFVMALPFFVMILMLIVQASHIMIANIVVHYGAFASARSAIVWIPANVNALETANQISTRSLIQETENGWQYQIHPGGEKFPKIHRAAALACLSLGPSRDLSYQIPVSEYQTQFALLNLFAALTPQPDANNLIDARLSNKLAYSLANTELDLTAWHRKGPFPGYIHDAPLDFFQANELGWQDHITARVTYNLPLLPGPVRLFAPAVRTADGDARVDQTGNVYIWPITATATLGLEGAKPLIPYWQEGF